jgi:putative ATP-dependent endonuclease of OLD family
MRVKKIAVKNFRLLEDVELSLEDTTTLIVGRNNSGKTSLTELFRRILSGNEPEFTLQDFSLGVHEKFWNAFVLKSTLEVIS